MQRQLSWLGQALAICRNSPGSSGPSLILTHGRSSLPRQVQQAVLQTRTTHHGSGSERVCRNGCWRRRGQEQSPQALLVGSKHCARFELLLTLLNRNSPADLMACTRSHLGAGHTDAAMYLPLSHTYLCLSNDGRPSNSMERFRSVLRHEGKHSAPGSKPFSNLGRAALQALQITLVLDY